MPFDSHFLIPDAAGRRLLLLRDGAGWRLPRWPVAEAPPERDPGFPVPVRAWIREHLGLDAVVLYWRNVEAPGRGDASGRQSVYVLEARDPPAAPPAGGRWVGDDDLASLPLVEAHQHPVIGACLAESSGEHVPPERQPWQRRGWFAEASRWIGERLAARGTPAVATVTQWHTKGGCCLLRTRTAVGGVYFKALPAMYAREPLLTSRLAELRPNRIVDVLAVDAERRWLLTAECPGAWLPTVDDAGAWTGALRALAELQVAGIDRIDELRARGCPDLRLGRLPAMLDGLLDDGSPLVGEGASPAPWLRVGLEAEELRGLRALVPRLRASLERLAGYGLPDTLEHGDFHPGQVIVAERGPVIIDWADSVLSHPFFSLARFITNAFRPNRSPPSALVDPPASRELLRDAYLEPWTAFAPMDRLREAADLALPLGALEHAVNCAQLDFNRRGIPWERSGGTAMFLRQLLALGQHLRP